MTDPTLWCPMCRPQRPLSFDGEVWRCERCQSWWSSAVLSDLAEPEQMERTP